MSDWTQFLSEIKRKRSEIRCSNSGCWYRGAAESSHGLFPKLIWNKNQKRTKPDAEDNLYQDYTSTLAEQGANSWVTLVKMQHYGVLTRLLDWTDCFGVALYFALHSGSEQKNPVIWLLNPFSLACRARSSTEKSIGRFHLDPDMDYYMRFIKEKNWPYKFAMPFYSPRSNERIRAQRGFFTVHGTSVESIHKYAAHHVRMVDVPESIFDDCNTFLDLAGINHFSVFPDHEGWIKNIKKEYLY